MKTFWTRFLTAALVVYLLRVLLIAGEGKGEPEVSVGRFSVDAAFSETKEFLPPSYLEAARDPEFKESLICLGYRSRERRPGHTGIGSSMPVRERRRSFM